MNTQKVVDINTSVNFKGRTKLTSVVIPNSVTWIGTSAFNGCTGLTSVIMQDGEKDVTYLGNNAFDGCTNLTKTVLCLFYFNVFEIYKMALILNKTNIIDIEN